jgi:hypothetical protein
MTFSLAALCVACGSADDKPTLSSLSPAGDACPSGGGVVTSSGVDDDGDGVLDESEIDDRVTLCAENTLTRLDAIAPGEICPNGGTSIKAGTDDDRDGLLDDAEVDTSQTLCKGTIVRTTPIAPTEPACLGFGGVRLELGVDDDGDDILDDAEIDLTTVSCNRATESQRPASPPAAFDIFLDGGDSNGGQGGAPGNLYAEMGGTGGGTLAFFDTGVADAGFTMPVHTPVLGANPLTVDADLTLAAWCGSPPAENVPYVFAAEIYLSKGNSSPTGNPRVSSLTVAAGVTLSVDSDALYLSDDVINNGTIQRAGTGTAVALNGRSYVGGPGSKVDAVAPAGVASLGIRIDMRESIYNQGTLDATGGTGTAGGNGGPVTLEADRSLYNSGDVITTGGASTGATSVGANGGEVYFYAYAGTLFNSGDITTTGGVGTRTGGNGGILRLYAFPGELRNSGNLDTSGAVPDCTAACRGGTANTITLDAYGGPITNSGNLTARGATVTAANGCGGGGGSASFNGYENGLTTLGQGGMRVSGTIDLRGGGGGSGAATPPCDVNVGGGPGGSLSINGDPRLPLGQEVLFLGYRSVSATGGDSGGAFTGRIGGGVSLYRYGDYDQVLGSIQNWVPITVSGGAATGTGTGGDGGAISMSYGGGGTPSYTAGNGANNVKNYGVLTNDGGNGATGGGVSGNGYAILLHGPEGVTNGGELRVRGGTGTAGGGGPGEGPTYRYAILLTSDVGIVTNTAPLTADGGDGTTHGGGAGEICLEGISVSNSAAITAEGGNAGAALQSNGDGNDAWLKSFYGTSQHTGSFSGAAGTGGTGGVAGELYLDVLDGRCYAYGNNEPT